MKIFINEIVTEIISSKEVNSKENYDLKINVSSEKDIKINNLLATNLIEGISDKLLPQFLKNLQDHSTPDIKSVTFLVNNQEQAFSTLKNHYELVEAAGGLVTKNSHYLLIFRLNKWDLPKGKIENGETPETSALREVKEECNIKVKLGSKIGNTWHTYFRDNKYNLKKTHWFAMQCLDDSEMSPQKEEDIQMLKWIPENEVKIALEFSYGSIRDIFDQYMANKKDKPF